jgi:uncharacterized protein YndB with AHSA1/START domain
MKKTLRKEAFYPHPIEDVWIALTDPQAIAEWLMPNDFQPIVGRTFRFHVDPMPGFSGVTECQVLTVAPPHRLEYTWVPVPKDANSPRPDPMTVSWTLTSRPGGTLLVLEQSGLETLPIWHRFSMNVGWRRMMRRLLPRVLGNVQGGRFRPGAIRRRDYGTKTVPPGFAK